jgi:DNA-directed RNA polymerase specialized sigma24 family protein
VLLTAIEVRRPRIPEDLIAPQHEDIHAELNLWGRQSRTHTPRLRCGSAEKLYRVPRGAEYDPQPKPALLPPYRILDLDRAILRMPDLHRQLIREYYVRQTRPEVLCRRMAIHWSHFGKLMFDSRAMVLNLLRS